MAQANSLVGWGDLNKALNLLRKERVFLSYKTGMGKAGAVSIEISIEKGADQAEVLRRVREALPSEFGDAQVRTRVA